MRWYQRVASGTRRLPALGDDSTDKKTPLLIIALYTFLTLVITYPLITKVTTDVGGYEHKDVFKYLWLLWWIKKSLVELHTSPANTVLQYYPFGAYQPLLLLDSYLLLSSFPLNLVTNLTLTYNFRLLLSYVLSGFNSYLLCYHLTKDKTASFIGGLVFAFSPFHTARATDGHLILLDIFWFPLYALYFLRLIENPSHRNAFMCGVFLTFSLLVSPVYNAYFTIPFTILALSYHGIVRRDKLWNRKFAKALLIAGSIAGLVIAPFYLPFLIAYARGSLGYLQTPIKPNFSADLLDFFIPPPTHLLVKSIAPLRHIVTSVMSESRFGERVLYIGLVPLSLAVLGAWKRRLKAEFWVVLGGVCGLLSLGPQLRVGERLVQYNIQGISKPIYLPHTLLEKLPLYEFTRTPARFNVTVVLSLAVLVSLGISALASLRRSQRSKAFLVCILSILTLVEYTVVFPFPTSKVSIPQFYDGLASDPGDFGVMDLGGRRTHLQAMLFQTVHEHGILISHIYHRRPEEEFTDHLTQALFSPGADIVQGFEPLHILERMKIKYVVLHKGGQHVEAASRYLPLATELLGNPAYEDDQIVAWEVPPSISVTDNTPIVVLASGWHRKESRKGASGRRVKDEAIVLVKSFDPRLYQLKILAQALSNSKRLQIFVNDVLVEEFQVGIEPRQLVTSPFTLRPEGINNIRLFIPQGCERPRDLVPNSKDRRCGGLFLQALEVSPADIY